MKFSSGLRVVQVPRFPTADVSEVCNNIWFISIASDHFTCVYTENLMDLIFGEIGTVILTVISSSHILTSFLLRDWKSNKWTFYSAHIFFYSTFHCYAFFAKYRKRKGLHVLHQMTINHIYYWIFNVFLLGFLLLLWSVGCVQADLQKQRTNDVLLLTRFCTVL